MVNELLRSFMVERTSGAENEEQIMIEVADLL
jgi:hypothetical protein